MKIISRAVRYPVSFLLVFVAVFLAGCGHLQPNFDKPSVKVVSLRALPSSGMEQKFAIGLRITNPNSIPISLAGMSYQLRLQGYDLLSGVATDIPEISGYSEVPLEVNASVNLINSLRIIQSLLSQRNEALDYELAAKLDLSASFLPAIRLVEKGQISLTLDGGNSN